MEHIIQFGLLAVLLLLGLIAGGYAERRHLKSLSEREAANSHVFISQMRTFPYAIASDRPPMMVVGEVAIASDYLKSFLSNIRKIFGGEMRSYHSLAVRARREAIQQLVEQAQAKGYNAICNIRLESADIGDNSKRRSMPMVAVLASGTAYNCLLPSP